jgi:hypothetical protein
MKIKHSSWFAAGPEVKVAMTGLSDGAFKLYMFLCLNAKRDSGTLSMSYANIASELGKSLRSVNTYLKELRALRVCTLTPAGNQFETSAIEIENAFWPYIKPAGNGSNCDEVEYVQKIRSLLAARACVKCFFTGADEKIASCYFRRGISVAQLERAIALGCSRKYVSWLNGAETELIVTLSYFADVVEEACDQETPDGYWDYLLPRLTRLESMWLQRSASATKPRLEAQAVTTL